MAESRVERYRKPALAVWAIFALWVLADYQYRFAHERPPGLGEAAMWLGQFLVLQVAPLAAAVLLWLAASVLFTAVLRRKRVSELLSAWRRAVDKSGWNTLDTILLLGALACLFIRVTASPEQQSGSSAFLVSLFVQLLLTATVGLLVFLVTWRIYGRRTALLATGIALTGNLSLAVAPTELLPRVFLLGAWVFGSFLAARLIHVLFGLDAFDSRNRAHMLLAIVLTALGLGICHGFLP